MDEDEKQAWEEILDKLFDKIDYNSRPANKSPEKTSRGLFPSPEEDSKRIIDLEIKKQWKRWEKDYPSKPPKPKKPKKPRQLTEDPDSGTFT